MQDKAAAVIRRAVEYVELRQLAMVQFLDGQNTVASETIDRAELSYALLEMAVDEYTEQ